MVVYEVTAIAAGELAGDFEEFMRAQHIPDVLAAGFFSRATFFRSSETRFCTRYEAVDEEALNNYFEREAPRLREEFAIRFPEGIEVSREIWKEIERFLVEPGIEDSGRR